MFGISQSRFRLKSTSWPLFPCTRVRGMSFYLLISEVFVREYWQVCHYQILIFKLLFNSGYFISTDRLFSQEYPCHQFHDTISVCNRLSRRCVSTKPIMLLEINWLTSHAASGLLAPLLSYSSMHFLRSKYGAQQPYRPIKVSLSKRVENDGSHYLSLALSMT